MTASPDTADGSARRRLRPRQRLFLALDTPDLGRALALARTVGDAIGGVKLGKEFFTATGPQGVRAVAALGLPVFLDLKFHDIPTTVAAAVRAALPLAPAMLTVHASGGAAMVRAAAAAVREAADDRRPLLLAVTVLTSLSGDDLAALGVSEPLPGVVERLAQVALAAGADGLVCSAHEVARLRRRFGGDPVLVVPGIRPAWAPANDQQRTMTPADAVAAGADYLVIGRPVSAAADPAAAAHRIAGEIADAG